MSEKRKSSKPGEHTIKLTISLDDDAPTARIKTTSTQRKPAKDESVFTDEADLLKLANLVKKTAQRNTEHGKTQIQILDFREESQRKKIIRMMVDHYSQILWKLLPYLRTLGGHPRAEIRKRTSETVGELMCEDFIRVKDEVIVPWARHASPLVNANVGLALAVIANDTRYAGNVKALLHHWATVSNPDLNWTALASCVTLGSLWPEDTLGFVEKSLERGRVELLALSIFVIRELSSTGHADQVLSRLAEWIRSKDQNTLRAGAALVFLEAVELVDLAGSGNRVDKAVEVCRIALEDRRLDNIGVFRAATLEKLKEWVKSGSDKKSSRTTIEKLITRLYLRSDERGKERLVFNLERWSHEKNGQGEQFKNLLGGLTRKDR
jgi:hypothetical protein